MQLKRFIAGMLLINCLFAFGQMNESEPEKIENIINTFYKSSAKRTIDITHTRLELTPFFDQKSLYGKALLSIKPYNLPIDRIALDSQGMKIKQVFIIEENDSIEVSYTYNDDLHLIVNLNRTYRPDEPFTLFIEYSANFSAIVIGIFLRGIKIAVPATLNNK